MKIEFTPGPWKVAKEAIGDRTPYPVVTTEGFRVAWVNEFASSFGDEKTEANARLIASAPELLKVVRYCERVLRSNLWNKAESYTGGPTCHKQLLEAIELAGSTPE